MKQKKFKIDTQKMAVYRKPNNSKNLRGPQTELTTATITITTASTGIFRQNLNH